MGIVYKIIRFITNNIHTITLFISASFIVTVFIFNPHYVELTGVLETWFPYKGLIPYKDFAAYHFPLGRWILLPLHLISNWNLELDPFMALIFGLGTLWLIYLFGSKFISKAATAISLIFLTTFFWYAATGILFFHEILIGFLISLILYLFIKTKDQKKFTPLILITLGILISLTELSGQIASITVAVIALYMFVVIKPIKHIIFFIFGISLPIIFILIYFILNKALWEFFYYNVIYYIQYNGYKKELLSLPYDSLIAFYTPLISLIIWKIFTTDNQPKKNNLTNLFLILSISTIPFIIFSVYHPHHLNYALPILAISAGLSYDGLKSTLIGKFSIFTASLIFTFTFFTVILPWHTSRIITPPTLKIANDTYEGDDMYKTVQWVKDNTPLESKIMVLGDGMFFLRSNRLPASRPSKGLPFSWEPFDQVKQELLKNPPDYWIIGKTFTNRLVKNYDSGEKMINFVNKQLNSCYKQVFELEIWQVWEKSCQ